MRWLTTSTLLLSPFLLGLNRPLAWTALATVLLAALLCRRQWVPARSPAPTPLVLRAALACAALFALALPLLQLAGGTCAALPSPAPCVTDPEPAWLGLVLAVMLACWCLLLGGPRRPTANDLLMAIALAGSAQALYALAAHFLGFTPLLLGNAFHHAGVPTGGFANRNHLAAFLYLGIFAAVALVLRLPADTGTGRAARWRLLLDQRLLWRLAVVLMVLALVATRSRAGNAAFLVGLLAGLAWLLLVEKRRRQGSSHPLRWRFVAFVIASVLLLDTLLIGSFIGLDRLRQRIADTALESEQRGDVNRVLLAHPELFTVAGHGAGSFAALFEPVKPGNLPMRYAQAHNDYLQVLVERGWLGAALFAGALALALWQALVAGRRRRRSEVRFALVAATAALATHASVEYVSQVPVIWLAWLGLLTLALRAPPPVPDNPRN